MLDYELFRAQVDQSLEKERLELVSQEKENWVTDESSYETDLANIKVSQYLHFPTQVNNVVNISSMISISFWFLSLASFPREL